MRYFKSALIFSLLIFACSDSFSQHEKKYSSKEEDAYNERWGKLFPYKEFVPVSIERAMNNPYNYVYISKVEHPTIYASQRKEEMIRKLAVLKEEKMGDKWAVIYYDSKYDDLVNFRVGYWLALSYDHGKTWKQYYTGLSEYFYYHFKGYSKLPLWKNAETLQIESAIFRQDTEGAHPMPPSFEMIQDSISVELNISQIILDSDNDGLTDIVEKKLMLDPHNPDTDGDGVPDSKDKNPRFKSVKTPKSMLYENLLENVHLDADDEINLNNPPTHVNCPLDSLNEDVASVNVLVTEDKDLQGINPHSKTIIILSPKEYQEYQLNYPSPLKRIDMTPLFKCDQGKNVYKIRVSESTRTSHYYIQKTTSGWKILTMYYVVD